jgi:hypothetical protein
LPKNSKKIGSETMVECETCKYIDYMDNGEGGKIMICMKYKGNVCGNRKEKYLFYEPSDDFISEEEMEL